MSEQMTDKELYSYDESRLPPESDVRKLLQALKAERTYWENIDGLDETREAIAQLEAVKELCEKSTHVIISKRNGVEMKLVYAVDLLAIIGEGNAS